MKSYGDACGVTRALDIVGERWALPVVRELVFGPRRYSDLSGALPGVSTNILGDRLKHLTEAGVVSKRRLAPPAASTVYELTPWGAALEPVLIAIGAWAAHTPIDLEHQSFSPASFALSLKTTFDAEAARGARLHMRFVMHEDVFDVSIEDGTLRVGRSGDFRPAPASGDETPTQVRADPKTLAAIVYAGLDPAEAERAGSARIEGSSDAMDGFAQCFTLPEQQRKGLS